MPPASERSSDSPPAAPPARQRHWRALRALTLGLLLVWGAATFGVAWQARSLEFSFFGWPFSFWVAAQGAVLVYLLLVAVYAWAARRLDEACGLDERD